jgi:hypothetical protein
MVMVLLLKGLQLPENLLNFWFGLKVLSTSQRPGQGWAASGLKYPDLIDELIVHALERHGRRKRNTSH